MIHVIATVELLPGRLAAFLDEFRKVVPRVLEEPGCLEYGPAVDAETDIPAQLVPRGDVVTIVEKWQSVEHLKQHLVAPHMQDYRPRVKPWIAGSTLVILTPA